MRLLFEVMSLSPLCMIQQGWALLLAIAVPVGTIVSGITKLQAARKASLEIAKLTLDIKKAKLEISNLEIDRAKVPSVIKLPSDIEVETFGKPPTTLREGASFGLEALEKERREILRAQLRSGWWIWYLLGDAVVLGILALLYFSRWAPR